MDTKTADDVIASLTEGMKDGLSNTEGKSLRKLLKEYRAQTQAEFEESGSRFTDSDAALLEQLINAEESTDPKPAPMRSLTVSLTYPPRHAAVIRRAAKKNGMSIEEWAIANIVGDIENGDIEGDSKWVKKWESAPPAPSLVAHANASRAGGAVMSAVTITLTERQATFLADMIAQGIDGNITTTSIGTIARHRS